MNLSKLQHNQHNLDMVEDNMTLFVINDSISDILHEFKCFFVMSIHRNKDENQFEFGICLC